MPNLTHVDLPGAFASYDTWVAESEWFGNELTSRRWRSRKSPRRAHRQPECHNTQHGGVGRDESNNHGNDRGGWLR